MQERSFEELLAHAKVHLSELVRRKLCRNWRTLREKLMEEVAAHKTMGPLAAPPDMLAEDLAYLAVGHCDLVLFPHGTAYAVALHFDVEQREPDGSMKVRGCDD